MSNWKKLVESFDIRRNLVIPGDKKKTIEFCVEQFIDLAKEAIQKNNKFTVALTGGSTPKEIYHELSLKKDALDWSKVYLFWSDERSVAADNKDSNFKMAMDAGFANLPIPSNQIFRMVAEIDIVDNAKVYEDIITKVIPEQQFDLVLLGMGDDGHTASLFPKTHALHEDHRLIAENYVPKLDTWRMTFTYTLINKAKNISIIVLGETKAKTMAQVLCDPFQPDLLPVQKVGTSTNPALWILDNQAAKEIKKKC
ncbi:6-phosphogluconolactonase [Candidatus Rubidus massiliensis]|nr:6-phosphogluconolactonase [Candidatus Rubidus massiliensis]